MNALDKLVKLSSWGHTVLGVSYFHGSPNITGAREELSDLRTRIEELEGENERLKAEVKELNTYIVTLYKVFKKDTDATKAFDCLGLLFLVIEANKAWLTINPEEQK